MDERIVTTIIDSGVFLLAGFALSFLIGAALSGPNAERTKVLRRIRLSNSLIYIASVGLSLAVGERLSPSWIVAYYLRDSPGEPVFAILASFVFIALLYVAEVLLPSFYFSRRIRNTSERLSTFVNRGVAQLFFSALQWVLLFSGFAIIHAAEVSPGFQILLVLLLSTIVQVLFVAIATLQWRFSRQRLREREKELWPVVSEFAQRCGVRLGRLFYFDTSKAKVANAFSISVPVPTVAVFSYLYENLKEGETKAILAHELGHLKMRHTLIRTAVIVVSLTLTLFLVNTLSPLGSGSAIEWYAWALICIMVCTQLIPGFLYRSQENAADLFAARSVADPVDLGRALMKTALLNDMSQNSKNWLGTHPAFTARMRYLEQKLEIPILEVLEAESNGTWTEPDAQGGN